MSPSKVGTLSDVLTISSERMEPRDFADRSFNYIGLEDIESNTGRIRAKGCTPASEIRSAKNMFRAGHILYGRLRPNLNKVHLAESDGICSTDIFVLACDEKLLVPAFAAYYLRSERVLEAVKNLTVGANLPRIDAKSFLGIPIPLPPLSEQKRIVRILDETESLRRLRCQADKQTEMFPHALFEEVFGNPVSNPKGWPKVSVSKFVRQLQAGRSVAPAGEESGASEYRILKVSSVTWGRFAAEESKPVPHSYKPTAEQHVRHGDMLFSRANTAELVGATVIVEEDAPGNLLLPDKLWRFVWHDPKEIEPRFVLFLFQHPSIRRELGSRATGTGGSMKNISMDKVMTMDLPLPPLELQRSFSTTVADVRALESVQAVCRGQLDDLFRSLLRSAIRENL